MAEPETPPPPPSDPLSSGLSRIPGFGQPPASAGSQASAGPSAQHTGFNQPCSEPTTSELATPSNPRILIIACQEKNLTSLSPFQRRDGCNRYGKVSRCDKLRDGAIEVEFVSSTDAERALRAKTFTYTERYRGIKREITLPVTVTHTEPLTSEKA